MSKYVGCALILSGVALAGVTLPFADSSDAHPSHALDIVEVVPASPGGKDVGRVAAQAASQVAAHLTADREHRGKVPNKELAAVDAPLRKPVAPFQTVTVPNDPIAIARALQTELRRVGCYQGEINGVWSPMAKKAMKAFTGTVNASLPVDRPDYILLTLVRGHADKACGQNCPSGQALGDEGRCLPAAVQANAVRKPVPAPVVIANANGAVPQPTPTPPQASKEPAPRIVAVPVAPAPPAPPVVAALANILKPAEAPPAAPFVSQTPRMGLAGPPGQIEPVRATPHERPGPTAAERARAREHRAMRERRYAYSARKPAYSGQTRWARDVFRQFEGLF